MGFGDNSSTPFGYSDNQRVASTSGSAAIGQPIAVARVATQASVPCEVLVQQQAGDGYQCTGGYCLQLALYVRSWCAHYIQRRNPLAPPLLGGQAQGGSAGCLQHTSI